MITKVLILQSCIVCDDGFKIIRLEAGKTYDVRRTVLDDLRGKRILGKKVYRIVKMPLACSKVNTPETRACANIQIDRFNYG